MVCLKRITTATLPGFTILELLVTVTIMVILTGIGLAGYLNFQEKQQVQLVAQDVQQLFSETRRKAQVNDQSACPQTAGSPTFVRASSHSIEVTPDGRSIIRTTGCLDLEYENFPQLPSGVTIDPAPLTVTYMPFATEVTGYAGDVLIKKGTTTYQFTITSDGTVGAVEKVF